MHRILFVTFLIVLQALPAWAVQFSVSPRLSAWAEYTDNLNRTKENKVEDVTYIISPGISLNLDSTGERGGLSLSYDPGFVSYRDGTVEEDWRHRLRLNGWYDISKRTHISFYDSLIVSEDPADDVTDQSGTRRGRSRYATNDTNIDLRHRFGQSDSFNLGYTYFTTLNDDEFYEDNRKHNPYANLTWWFAPGRLGLDLHADYTRGEFDRSDDLENWLGRVRLRRRFTSQFDMFLQYGYINTEYTGETESYYFHDTGIGFTYVVGEHISTTFVVSYLRRVSEISGKEDDVFASWDINAIWPLRKGYIGLRGSSGYTVDQFAAGGRGFSLYSGIIGDVNWTFTRTLSGDIFANYRYNRFIDFEPEREDHIVSAGPGLSWQALSWMRFRLAYTYNRLFSPDEQFEYDENRVYLSVNLEPRKPFSLSN